MAAEATSQEVGGVRVVLLQMTSHRICASRADTSTLYENRLSYGRAARAHDASCVQKIDTAPSIHVRILHEKIRSHVLGARQWIQRCLAGSPRGLQPTVESDRLLCCTPITRTAFHPNRKHVGIHAQLFKCSAGPCAQQARPSQPASSDNPVQGEHQQGKHS